MSDSSKTVKTAYVIAFLIAAYCLLVALTKGPVLLLAGAFIAGMAGWGIRRGRVWSAYGFALYLALEVIMIPIALSRSSGDGRLMLVASGLLGAALTVLFFRAGRSLETVAAERGRAWPWIAVSLLFSVPVLFLGSYEIPSTSMENTVLRGDRLFVRAWPKPQPKRDDVWAFRYPVNRREVYLKRIVGIPGDRVHLLNKVVYRNGVPLTEPYAKHQPYFDTYRDSFPSGRLRVSLPPSAKNMLQNNVVNGDVIVPKDRYFVLGDNRDDSSDSRYWGFVAASDLIGKPWLVYDSREMPSTDLTRPSALTTGKPRWNRFFKRL